jgi:F-type H+-transporting ATPase subunit b
MLLLAIGSLASDQGFNPLDPHLGGNAFWTWVIFLLSLPLMWKVVFGPIAKALIDRDQRAEDAIAKAEQARVAAEKAKADTIAELDRARAETTKLVAEARERSERQAREMMDQAKAEAQRALDKARDEIDAEKARALTEIRQEAVELSIFAARQILKRDMDDETHRRFVGDLLQRVESTRN